MSQIDRLSKLGIVRFDLLPGGELLQVRETTDNRYSINLSKKQVRDLIDELDVIHDDMGRPMEDEPMQ